MNSLTSVWFPKKLFQHIFFHALPRLSLIRSDPIRVYNMFSSMSSLVSVCFPKEFPTCFFFFMSSLWLSLIPTHKGLLQYYNTHRAPLYNSMQGEERKSKKAGGELSISCVSGRYIFPWWWWVREGGGELPAPHTTGAIVLHTVHNHMCSLPYLGYTALFLLVWTGLILAYFGWLSRVWKSLTCLSRLAFGG